MKKNNLFLLTAALVLLICYYAIFGSFFPNNSGRLGHDYAFFLPALLDGYFWYHTNGLWKIPWFTPSFCGGTLSYVRVFSGFYTLPQFLTFLFDPLTAIRLTLIVCAALGFGGFYLLLRRAFFASQPAAFMAAGLFLFNGFYAHRMLIGHIGFHPFMLLPLITYFLLRPIAEENQNRYMQISFDSVVAGLLLAYMVQAGFATLMTPAIIAIVVIGLVHNVMYGRYLDFWTRWAAGGFVGVLLCSSKLTAVFYFMENFSRNLYPLPGAKSFMEAFLLLFKSLFISPAFDADRVAVLTNLQMQLNRHEWEYSITLVPLVIILWGSFNIWRRIVKKGFQPYGNRTQWLLAAAIGALMLLPVAINTYSPGWNAFLKQVPLIKNSSSLIRWFIIPVPVVILAAALMLEKITAIHKYQISIVVLGMVAVVTVNALTDRHFYHMPVYDPKEIVEAYHNVRSGLYSPEITNIAVYVDGQGRPTLPGFRNNAMVYGSSQLWCYDPIFGYGLENFPTKSLHPGPVLEERNGILNIKNPACYVWPKANNCEPGDHFTKEQKNAAEAFVNYRPYPFRVPDTQKVADWVNGLGLAAVLIFLIFYSAVKVLTFARKQTKIQ